MEASQRHYKALLDVYRAVYASITVDFDSIDKEDGFSDQYIIPKIDQQVIMNKVLDKKQFCELEKRAIRSAYWAGCSPRIA